MTLTAAERRIASARLLAVPCGWFGVDGTGTGPYCRHLTLAGCRAKSRRKGLGRACLAHLLSLAQATESDVVGVARIDALGRIGQEEVTPDLAPR